jgi:hypothetical protein
MSVVRAVDFLDASWRKATASQANGACVEVANVGRVIATRDSKRGGESPVLMFTCREWQGVIARIKAGRLDLD